MSQSFHIKVWPRKRSPSSFWQSPQALACAPLCCSDPVALGLEALLLQCHSLLFLNFPQIFTSQAFACGILVPQEGIKPTSPAVAAES